MESSNDRCFACWKGFGNDKVRANLMSIYDFVVGLEDVEVGELASVVGARYHFCCHCDCETNLLLNERRYDENSSLIL